MNYESDKHHSIPNRVSNFVFSAQRQVLYLVKFCVYIFAKDKEATERKNAHQIKINELEIEIKEHELREAKYKADLAEARYRDDRKDLTNL